MSSDISRTYLSAFGVYLNSAITQFVTPDISGMELHNVSKYFQRLSVVIYDKMYDKNVSIDLFRYLNEFEGSTLTIQEWLNTKENVPLITSNRLPSNVSLFATYSDIEYRNFKLLPGDTRLSVGDQNKLTVSKAPDIRVIKKEDEVLDYRNMVSKTLWTINGHLVRAVADDHALYLLGAGKHFKVNDNIHVGCINLNLVSNVETCPITKDNLTLETTAGRPEIHITLSDRILDKKVWVSLAGRLLFDGIIRKVGDRTIAVDLSRYDLVNRIFRSQDFIDLEDVIDNERVVIDKNYYKDEKVLFALFTHISSFVVILDNPYVNVSREKLIKFSHPYTYFTKEQKKLPLLLSNGLIPKYHTRKHINDRLLDIDIGIEKQYLSDTTGANPEVDVYHKQVSSAFPGILPNAYLLKIQAMTIED